MKNTRRTRSNRVNDYDEDQISYGEIKQMKEKKKYRNFDNALRSKNIEAILEYSNQDDDANYEQEYYHDY